MKILVLYETYSGGTLEAASYVTKLLQEKGADVLQMELHASDPQTYLNYDLIVMGTPSWMRKGQEGQPHIHVLEFMEQAKDMKFTGKFALFGLGDSTYAHYARGVDMLEVFLKDRGATVITPSLKVDSYLFDQKKGNESISQWVHSLPLV